MANKFNLTAELNLRGPANIKTVVAGIRRELGTVTADVKLKIDPAASRNISTITSKLTAMNNVLASAKNNTDSLNIALKNLSSSIQSVNAVNTKTISSTSKVSSTIQATAQAAQIASSKFEEFGKQSALAIKRFAAFSVVTTGVYALIGAINDGLKSFILFDKQLVRLQQITGQTKTQLGSLEQTITQLATNFGVSSESLIGIADTLAQAGLSAEETRVALKALAMTELAPSFDDITRTTEGAIAAMRQFGLAATDLEDVLGSINAVAARFAVESGDIIAAIQRTGGVFASASKGVSQGKDALNEFIAVFTSVRATTRESAETIATGLRTIFTRIQRAGTIKQLREFGVELQDLENKFVGPFEAVRRLSEALNQLDPRDVRFSTIIEELGGFRQVGKVIPLIQQFATAQEALKVAQTGQSSLSGAQVKSQQALGVQIAKVREEFLALVRDIGKSSSFQALAQIILGLASTFIKLVGAFKPILPILAVIGAIKGAGAITKFAGGFLGAFGQGGGAKSVGSNVGEKLTGAAEKEKAQVTARAADATRSNTDALHGLTSAIKSLESAVRSKSTTGLRSGGKVLGFNKGGIVPGNGGGDKVPAFLEGGEVVINRKAAQRYGADRLLKLNNYKGGSSRGVKNKTGRRSRFKPLSEKEISRLSTRELMDYVNSRELEDYIYSSGAGMSIGMEFVTVPKDKIIPEIEKDLVVGPNGDKGFWREKIATFGRETQASTKKTESQKRREAFFDKSRELLMATSQGLLDPRSALSKERKEAFKSIGPSVVGDYEKSLFATPRIKSENFSSADASSVKSKFIAWGKNPASGIFSSVIAGFEEQIRNQLDEPNKSRFDTLISSGSLDAYKAAGGKDGHIPPLKKAIYGIVGLTEKKIGGLIRQYGNGSEGGVEAMATQKILDKLFSGFVVSGGRGIRSITTTSTESGPKHSEISVRQLLSKKTNLAKLATSSGHSLKSLEDARQELTKQKTSESEQAQLSKLESDAEKETALKAGKVLKFGLAGLRFGTTAGIGSDPIALSETVMQKGAEVKRKFSGDMPGSFTGYEAIRPIKQGPLVQIIPGALSKQFNKIWAKKIEDTLYSDFSKSVVKTAQEFGNQIDATITNDQSEIRQRIDNAGFSNVIGAALESSIGLLGAPYIQKEEKTKSIDFPTGLGSSAKLFGIPSNIPTDITRTIGDPGKSVPDYIDQIQRFLEKTPNGQKYLSEFLQRKAKGGSVAIKKFAFGGRSDGPDFDEIRQQIIDKYPDIQFRISKRKSGFGYNLMGALKSKGGLFGNSELSFQQPGNLKQLQEYSDKLAAKLISSEQLAAGGFASGGSVPAMVSNGEAFVPPKLAKKIGYAKLDKMNQADRNGMKGFAGGGVSVFNGPGSGTSDSIGPIGLPQGSYVIREKATKALGLNKGGSVGVQRFENGGRLNKAERKRIKEQYLAEQRGGITREEARTVGMPRPDYGAGASRRKDVTATPQGLQNIKNIEGEVLNNYGKLYAEEKKRIDQLYDNLENKAREEFFEGTIDADELTDRMMTLYEAKILSKSQTKAKLTAQVKPAQLKAVEDYTAGKQTKQITTRKTQDNKIFEQGIESKMASVAEEVKSKYQDLLNQEVQSLKAFYKERAAKVKAEGGDVAAVVAEYKSALNDAKQSMESGMRAETKQQQAAVPDKIVESKKQEVQALRSAADPFYEAKKAADEYAVTVGDAAETSKQMAEEQKAYIEFLARQKGLSSKGLKLQLAKDLGKESYEIKQKSRFGQEEIKAMAAGSSRTLQGKDVKALLEPGVDTQESRQVQDIVNSFEAKIKEINPTIGGDKARDAAIALATGLAAGDQSVKQIIQSHEGLHKAIGTQISDTDAANEALRRTAAAAGMSEEALRSLVSKTDIDRQEFAQSPEGKRYGVIAEMMPDFTKQFSESGLGKGLGKVDDFFSGKGGRLSKLAGKAGGFTGLATAATAAIPFAAESLLTKEQKKDPNIAGGISAATGALSMGAAAYEMTGGGVTGLIAAAGAALLGGIKGWFEGKNQAVFQNAIDSLAKTTNGLEHAFQELEKEATPKNIKQFNKAAGDAFMAQQEIGNIAFSEQRNMVGSATSGESLGGAAIGAAIGTAIAPGIGTAIGAGLGYLAGAFKDYYSKFDPTQIAEAGAAYTNANVSFYEAQGRAAEIKTEKLPIEQVDSMMEALNNGVRTANPIIQSYAASLRSTGEFTEDQIATMSDEQSAIAAFLQLKKAQLGSEEAAVEELKKNKNKAIEVGRELVDAQGKRIVKEDQLKNAIKEVTVATASTLDIYRRLGANIRRYEAEMGDITNNIKGYIGDLTGSSSAVQDVDRGDTERVLGNISAYSAEQVKAAAAGVSGMLGNTPESKELADTASASKILQDQLPALLRSNEGNRGAAVDQLENLLKAQGLDSGAIDAVLNDIRKTVAEGEEKGTGTLIDEIDSGILSKFSQTAEEGSKKLQELTATYNNTIQEFINLQNQQSQAISKANEYYRQAAQIRLNAELDLAKALGRNLSLDELNKPFETEISSLTQGLSNIGVLDAGQAMDPAAIAAGIQAAGARNVELEASNKQLKGEFGAATDDSQRQALNNAQLDNIEALGQNKRAIEEGQAALQKLATDGSRAANALAKIQEEQKRLEAFGSSLDNALTASPGELAKMNYNTDAMNRVLAGDTKGLKTSQGRKAAFAGLQQDKELIGEAEYNKRLAVLRRQSLMETQGQVTPEQEKMIQRLEKGLPDEEDPNVKAYREASAAHQEANIKLGDMQMAAADKIGEKMDELRTFLADKFPGLLTQAVLDAKTASATAGAAGQTTQTAPDVKAEQTRREEADKEAAARKDEIQRAEQAAQTKSDKAARLDKEMTEEEKWRSNPIGRGIANRAAEEADAAKAKVERLKAADVAAQQSEDQKRESFDTTRKQQEQQAKDAAAAADAKKAAEDRARTQQTIDQSRGGPKQPVLSNWQRAWPANLALPIPAPPAPGTTQASYSGTRAVTALAPLGQAKASQQEIASRQQSLDRLSGSKTAKEEEIAKKEKALKGARIAAIGAGTLETSPHVAKAQEAVDMAKQDLISINEQIAAEKKRLAALAALAQIEAQNQPGATPTPAQAPYTATARPQSGVVSTPLPTPVPVSQQSATAVNTNDARQRTDRPQTGGPSGGVGYSLTVDDKSMEFLSNLTKVFNTFGTYVDKLAGLDLKLELTGNYTIDVNITGAAGLAAIDKSMRELATGLVEAKISELRDEISTVTRGAVKPSASKGTTK